MDILQPEIEPEAVGLDATRLARIGTHFARYVDDGRLPGFLVVVSRRGQLAYVSVNGLRDVKLGLPLTSDTIFRIYSMTKPIVAVAAMTLYENGALKLSDPVSQYIPSFAAQRVFVGGSPTAPVTRPVTGPMRIWHLLSHTSGLTMPTNNNHPVDALYRSAGLRNDTPFAGNLASFCEPLGAIPLLFEPGTRWNYSVSSDVLGRVIEVVSGMELDEFLSEHIFEPLAMTDTSFGTPEDKSHRLATLYRTDPSTGTAVSDDTVNMPSGRPTFFSGGGGLVSTASDYHRFTQMLMRGGELDGVRILSSRTVRYMTENHLPGGVDLDEIGQTSFPERDYKGIGFGLGFSIVIDPVKAKVATSRGAFGWGGAAGTNFSISPSEALTVLFFSQVRPANLLIRSPLTQLVYQSLAD